MSRPNDEFEVHVKTMGSLNEEDTISIVLHSITTSIIPGKKRDIRRVKSPVGLL